MTHDVLKARPPSGGRLDHQVQSLRIRLQRLQHEVEEGESMGHRRPNGGQLIIVPCSPRSTVKLSEIVRERREQQKRAVQAARVELAEARRDSALAQKYDKKILSCQRQINTQELLSEVRSSREQWRAEKKNLATQRRDVVAERASSARSQREHIHRVQSEHDSRMLRERRDLEDEIHRLQQQLQHQKASCPRDRAGTCNSVYTV